MRRGGRLQQLTLDGAFARVDVREAGELPAWERTLDLFAAAGTVPLGWLGRRRASLFAELGLVVFFRGALRLTERGAAAE